MARMPGRRTVSKNSSDGAHSTEVRVFLVLAMACSQSLCTKVSCMSSCLLISRVAAIDICALSL